MSETQNAALYIDGRWIGPEERKSGALIDPSTAEPFGRFPFATEQDIDEALQVAQRALPAWRAVPAVERGRIFHKAAALVRERLESISQTMTREQGKLIAEARAEMSGAAEHIDWTAEEGRRAYGQIVPASIAGMRQLVLVEPIGVVAGFSPWNFPATSAVKKISNSLAAGCCCILKAAEETPLTAMEIVRAFADAGVPKGVIGLLFGDPAMISTRLITSPIVRKISFTGSVTIGRQLSALAAQHGKPAVLELGGHAAVLVFADADVSSAVKLSAVAKFRNAGQVCTSPTRFLVERGVYERFVEEMTAVAKATALGPGKLATSGMGPLANPRRGDALDALITDAVEKGARLRTGGRRVSGRGYFFEPTVMTDVPVSARMATEEPFGPIAIVQPFNDEAEAIALANSTSYGLAAYAFTRDGSRQIRLGEQLQAGMVTINTFRNNDPSTPWGGVKDSGYGREGSSDGVGSFLIKKLVTQEY